jgi:hypothetical protein
MTLTAVQLRESQPACELVYGAPVGWAARPRGPVAFFGPGALVAYAIQSSARRRLFLFRTLLVDDRLAACVPGVHPHVQLLLDVSSADRIGRVKRLFTFLERHGWCPTELSDAFYCRVGCVLGGRLRAHKTLVSLLRQEGPDARGALGSASVPADGPRSATGSSDTRSVSSSGYPRIGSLARSKRAGIARDGKAAR